MQYQVGGIAEDNWTDATSGTTIENLQHGTTVYGRLFDGTNGSKHASIDVYDKIEPQEATIKLISTNVTTETQITATVTHIDGESGPDITKCKYVWNTTSDKIGINADLYTGGAFSSNGQTISQTMSSRGTYYLHILTTDKGGNATETVSAPITVFQLVTELTVSPISLILNKGETQQLTVTVNPTTADNKSVTWESSNSSIATVSDSGLVTAKSGGTAIITAKAADGSDKTATCSIIVEGEDSAKNILKVGDHVTYIDGTGEQRDCVVLYDNSFDYGVEIITMKTVENVTIGESNTSTITTNSINDYNNAINILNDATSKYINKTYVDRARCVGSVPNEPDYDEAGMYISEYSYMVPYNELFKDADNNYLTDKGQMISLDIFNTDDWYWLASREVYSSNVSYSTFKVRYVYPKNAVNVNVGIRINSNGKTSSYERSFGLRPVFHIKSGINITGGNGTESSPYTLEI